LQLIKNNHTQCQLVLKVNACPRKNKSFPSPSDVLGKRKKISANDIKTTPILLPPPVLLPPGGTASRGLSLNRSQYGGCSTKYNTPAGTQVVCRRFGGEQAVFPESSRRKNSSQRSSLTPAVCPGVRLAGTVDATPLAKSHVPAAIC
jgi:hypothetical protein